MNFTDGLLPFGWIVLGHLLYWPLLVWAVTRAPWGRLLAENEASHVWLGATVGVMVLWSLRAGFADGLYLHLLGATLVTLMFGWPLAVVAMSLVVLGVTLSGGAGATMFAMNALLLGVVPVTVSYGIYRFSERWLPRHLFIYIFLCAFFGAALAMGATGLTSAGVLSLAGAYSADYIHYNYLRYLPLIMFPEAFITGMLTTLLVVYYPRWVQTFDDARYLKGR